MRTQLQRVQKRYQGRVQGVGFRATVCDLSRQFSVVGQVRNRSDGSVELVAEGTDRELVEFCKAIQERLGRNIVGEDEKWVDIDAVSFDQFAIAYTSD